MDITDSELLPICLELLNELAFHIDLYYEDEDIGMLAAEGTDFHAFRRAYGKLERRGVEMPRLPQHVNRRILKCYSEYFEGGLPEPPPPRLSYVDEDDKEI